VKYECGDDNSDSLLLCDRHHFSNSRGVGAMQKHQTALQMMSNISKMNHDTSMGVIRKID
jgi:hypothetical protein